MPKSLEEPAPVPKTFGGAIAEALMECYFCDQRTDLMPERPLTRIDVVYDDVEEKYEAAFLSDDAATQAVGRCSPSPTKASPVKAAPVEAAPASPVKAAPVKAAPVEAAPVKASPVKASPVKLAEPAELAPAEPAPAEPAGRSVKDLVAKIHSESAAPAAAPGPTRAAPRQPPRQPEPRSEPEADNYDELGFSDDGEDDPPTPGRKLSEGARVRKARAASGSSVKVLQARYQSAAAAKPQTMDEMHAQRRASEEKERLAAASARAQLSAGARGATVDIVSQHARDVSKKAQDLRAAERETRASQSAGASGAAMDISTQHSREVSRRDRA